MTPVNLAVPLFDIYP